MVCRYHHTQLQSAAMIGDVTGCVRSVPEDTSALLSIFAQHIIFIFIIMCVTTCEWRNWLCCLLNITPIWRNKKVAARFIPVPGPQFTKVVATIKTAESDSARNLGSVHSARLKTVHEEARQSVKLLILSLNALIRSAGFSLKMQPRLSLLPVFSRLLQPSPHGYTQFCHPTSPENSKLCCKTRSLGTPPPTLNTPFLEKMYWLPISECIKYKVACMCFNVINGSGPAYFSELLHVYTPSHTLRSSPDTRMLKI